MTLKLYNNQSDNRYLQKNLIEIDVIENVVCLNATNISSPQFVLNPIDDFKSVNYVYCLEFNRYYYITNSSVTSANRIQINCNVDVLMSFRDSILNNSAIIRRGNSVGNVLVADDLQTSRADDIITNFAFSGCEFLRGVSAANYSFLLNCFGGNNNAIE